jgi:hypothetical protein
MGATGTRRAFLGRLTYLASAAATVGQLRPLLAAVTDGESTGAW